MAIRGSVLVDEDKQGSANAAESVVYVLHPNCAVEEYQSMRCICYDCMVGMMTGMAGLGIA